MDRANTLRTALRPGETTLLEQAVDAERPALRPLLDRPLDDLTASDLNLLRGAVTALLVRQGFDDAWEPTGLGRDCEALIDRLAPWHWGKEV